MNKLGIAAGGTMKIMTATLIAAPAAMPVFATETMQDWYRRVIESHGFEFRPKEVLPWGVPFEDVSRLTWVNSGKYKFQIDKTAALPKHRLDRFMLDYISKYGVREIDLTSELFLRTKATYRPSLADVYPMESPISIFPPPAVRYVVRLPSLPLADREYDVECVFMFTKLEEYYYLTYHSRDQYQTYDESLEPRCGAR